jgi:hypothetical protein
MYVDISVMQFPIQSGLKRRDALSTSPFIFAFEYSIGKNQEDFVELELSETQQPLIYVYDTLLGENKSH